MVPLFRLTEEKIAFAKEILEKACFPSWGAVEGEWFLFEKGNERFIEWVDEEGNLGGDAGNASKETLEVTFHYKVTLVRIFTLPDHRGDRYEQRD